MNRDKIVEIIRDFHENREIKVIPLYKFLLFN